VLLRYIVFLTFVQASLVDLIADPKTEGPHCAFSDEAFMTFLGIASCVTNYYVEHRAWPSTTTQLRAEMLQAVKDFAPASEKPSPKDVDQFFARFSRIKLTPRGRNLILDVQYQVAGEVHNQGMLIHPGRSTEEMLQASAEVK